MAIDRPRPEPEDLIGEIDRLRRQLAEAREQLDIVEHAGIVIDVPHKCFWWHKVKFLGPH